MVHLEANACGTWTVGSLASGNPDAIPRGNGDLIEPNDSVRLAQILEQKLNERPYIRPVKKVISNSDYVIALKRIIGELLES